MTRSGRVGEIMSFEEEWAQHKAAALSQQSAVRLNSVPAEPGSGSGDAGRLVADAPSINGNANLLIEIAALLHEGRPDAETSTMARTPRAHEDVSVQVARFARFAGDQFLDSVSLFAALATKLKSAGGDFVTVDDDNARKFLNSVLDNGRYVAPEAR
ncbi:hypothetical protein ACFU5O_09195 [Streptomyces sp. NPDC057445]|uniref:hypothetical protein n=1 Tax=Streptomyces sp. NPDC057445 TaxID=3346136 RepID=UPI0036B2D999